MTVLVAYGTLGGGTGWVAGELRTAGLQVHLAPAGEITDVTPYTALVLGSAVYATGWRVRGTPETSATRTGSGPGHAR